MARCFDGRLCVQMVFTELVVKLRKEGGSLKEHLEGLYKKWGTFSFFLVFVADQPFGQGMDISRFGFFFSLSMCGPC